MKVDPQARRSPVAAAMAERGIDALVASSFENFFYSSGSMMLSQQIVPSRLFFTVWEPDGTALAIVNRSDVDLVLEESWITDVRGYTEFREDPVDLLADALLESGVASGRVGIELNSLPAAHLARLTTRLPGATIVPADRVFDELRMVKHDDEIALLGEAAVATDAAIRTAYEQAAIGTTENEIVTAVSDGLTGAGADAIAFVFVAAGANARLVHPTAGDTSIAPGDIVRTDVGGYFGSYFGGYMSDLARMAVGGHVGERQRDVYRRLFDVHTELLESIRPGQRAADVYERCRAGLERRGFDLALAHVGHGIGISVHEHPMLEPGNAQELLPGMVMCIEPLVVDDGLIYHVEDTIRITENGTTLLSPSAPWAEIFEIR